MEIRKATLKDLNIVAELFDAYRQFYSQTPNLEAARNFIKDRIRQDQSVIFLAIDENEKGAGFTQLYPSFTSVGMKRLWVLNDLFVHEDFRRMGLGEQLIEKARQLARETNASGLMLETEVSNTSAQGLYDKMGFKRSDAYYVYYLTV